MTTALAVVALASCAPVAPAETGSTGQTEVATELSLSATNGEPREGELDTYTATLTPEPTSGGVEFYEDGYPINPCTAVPVENGVARCEAYVEHEGNVTIEARYTDELPNQLTAEWGESHNKIVIEAGISYVHELEDEELRRAEEARIEREAREDAERQEYEEQEHAREQTEREHEEHETTTELTASPMEPFSGHAIVYTAIVQAKNGETVNSGVVTFTVEGTRIEGCVAVPVNSTGEAVCETPEAPGGRYSGWRPYPYHAHAEYSDQEEPFGYSEGEVEVNVREPTTPTVSVTAGSEPRPEEFVSIKVELGSAFAEGTVTFYEGGSELACGQTTVVAGIAECDEKFATKGPHTVTAKYSGSTNGAYTAANGEGTVEVRESEAEEDEKLTHVLVTASPEPIETGESVTYTAHVKTLGEALVSGGTVEFTEDGGLIEGCRERPVSGGEATCTTTGGAGTAEHKVQIKANFSGNETEAASGELNVFEVEEGHGHGSSLPHVLLSEPTEITGTSAVIHAEVNPEGSETTCAIGWGTLDYHEHTTPCSASVGSGSSSVPVEVRIEGLAPGTRYEYDIEATNERGTEYGSIQFLDTYEPTEPTETRVGVGWSPEEPAAGESVTYHATVETVTEQRAVGGTVGFTDDGTAIAGCGARPVNGSGEASCETTAGGGGLHAIGASYSGEGFYDPSSGINGLDVASEVTQEEPEFAFTVSPEDPAVGQTVKYTLKVTGQGGHATGGVVRFEDDEERIGECSYVPINGNGEATCETTARREGSNWIELYFGGTEQLKPRPARDLVTVEPESTTTTTSSTTTSSATTSSTTTSSTTVTSTSRTREKSQVVAIYGPERPTSEESVHYTAVAEEPESHAPAHPGTMTFKENGTVISGCEKLSVNTEGEATCDMTAGSWGQHEITVVFESEAYETATSSGYAITDEPAPPVVVTGEAEEVTASSAIVHGEVNPKGSEVENCFVEYGTANAEEYVTSCSPTPGVGDSLVSVEFDLTSLSPGTTYHYRFVAANVANIERGEEKSFTTSSATTTTTSSPTTTTTTSPTTTTTSSTTTTSPTTTTSTTSSSTTTTTSAPPTTTTTSSTTTSSTTSSSTTTTTGAAAKPAVNTGSAGEVTATSAVLLGEVNPEGSEVTSCVIEWGPTNSFGKSVPCAPAPGSGSSLVTVEGKIEGLEPETYYAYRVVATNGGGTTRGETEYLETLPASTTTTTTTASSTSTSPTTTTTTSTSPTTTTTTSTSPTTTTTSTTPTTTTTSTSPTTTTTTPTTTTSTTTSSTSSSPTTTTTTSTSPTTTTTSTSRTTTSSTTTTTSSTTTSSSSTTTTTTSASAAPVVFTWGTLEVTDDSAVLLGEVNPEGGEVTECVFEYGTTPSYGQSAPCSPAPGAGRAQVPVEAHLTGLEPGTTYYFRLKAHNARGTEYGYAEEFATRASTTTSTTTSSSVSTSSTTTTTTSSSTTTTSPTSTTSSTTTTTSTSSSPTTTTSTSTSSSPTTTSSTTTASPTTTTTSTTSSSPTTTTTTSSPTTTTTSTSSGSSTTTTSSSTTTTTETSTTTTATTTEEPTTTTTTTTTGTPNSPVSGVSGSSGPAPQLTLLSKGSRPLINARTVIVQATCGPAGCSLAGFATVTLPGSRRVWHLGVAEMNLAAEHVGGLKLSDPYALRQAVRRYLLKHPRYHVRIRLEVSVMVDGHATQTVSEWLPIWTYAGFR